MNLKLLTAAAVLSTTIAAPAFAQQDMSRAQVVRHHKDSARVIEASRQRALPADVAAAWSAARSAPQAPSQPRRSAAIVTPTTMRITIATADPTFCLSARHQVPRRGRTDASLSVTAANRKEEGGGRVGRLFLVRRDPCRGRSAARRSLRRGALRAGAHQTPALGTIPVLRSSVARCIAPGTRKHRHCRGSTRQSNPSSKNTFLIDGYAGLRRAEGASAPQAGQARI